MVACILGTIAERTTEKPAHVPALKFPGGALLFYLTELYFPAWDKGISPAPLVDKQKIQLSLDMRWYCTPTLFITVDGLQ